MLGKVMKYEFRAAGRLLLPFFGLALVLSGVARLAQIIAPLIGETLGNILKGLTLTIGIFALFGIILLTFVYMVVRFYQSMVSGEAYLSFTLPVKVGTHLLGRLLVATIYCVASCLLAVVCAIILIPGLTTFISQGVLPVNFLGTMESITLADIPADLIWSIIGIFVVSIIFVIITNLLFVYVALATGPLLTKNRILGAIVSYLIISNVEGLLTLPLTPLVSRMMMVNVPPLAGTTDLYAFLGSLMSNLWAVIGIAYVLNLVFAVAHFFITRYMFTKKLNLE